MVLRAGDPCEVVTFVETLLPDGVDAILCGGIAYVAEVQPTSDVPVWADAVLLGGTAYVPKPLEL